MVIPHFFSCHFFSSSLPHSYFMLPPQRLLLFPFFLVLFSLFSMSILSPSTSFLSCSFITFKSFSLHLFFILFLYHFQTFLNPSLPYPVPLFPFKPLGFLLILISLLTSLPSWKLTVCDLKIVSVSMLQVQVGLATGALSPSGQVLKRLTKRSEAFRILRQRDNLTMRQRIQASEMFAVRSQNGVWTQY